VLKAPSSPCPRRPSAHAHRNLSHAAHPSTNHSTDRNGCSKSNGTATAPVAFIENNKARLISRNQNELTARYPELKDLPNFVKAKNAILDGEVVALDDEGRASFSLMQQRTGFRPGGRRTATNADVPVLYYAFDLLYLDGSTGAASRLKIARKS